MSIMNIARRTTIVAQFPKHMLDTCKLASNHRRMLYAQMVLKSMQQLVQTRFKVTDPARSLLTPCGSSPERNELSRDSQGMLHFNESYNNGDDTRSRYFGPTSGCFELRRSDGAPGHTAGDDWCSRHSELDDSTALEPMEPSATLKEPIISCYFEWDHPCCQFVNEDLFRQSERAGGG
ncbi:hypothetical protein ACKRZS_010561 [Fusarium odoratissimum]